MEGFRDTPTPSPPLRGEREGTRRVVSLQPTDLICGDGEGEVGLFAVPNWGAPHLTPTLSAPRGGEGERGGAWRVPMGEGSCQSKS
jgi:hypothetical protein